MKTGRPPLPVELRGVEKKVRLTPLQWKAYEYLGGHQWLRDRLDAYLLSTAGTSRSIKPNLVLAEDAITGLKEAVSGQVVRDDEFDAALGVASVRLWGAK